MHSRLDRPRRRPGIRDRHANSRLDIVRLQNTLKSKPGFGVKFPSSLPETGFLIFFLGRAVPYWPPKSGFSRTDDTRNAFRPLRPLRHGDRTDQIVLASDFPGAD